MTKLAIRKLEPGSLAAYDKVIPSAAYETLVEVQQALDQAKEEAEALRQSTYDSAFAAGKQQAERQASEMLLKASKDSAHYLASIEAQLSKVIVKLVKQIIGACDPLDAVTGMVAQTLHQLRDEVEVTIKVAPKDADEVRERLQKLAESATPSLEVVADPALAEGAARLEAAGGRIDTSLEDQLQLLEQGLLAQNQEPPPQQEQPEESQNESA